MSTSADQGSSTRPYLIRALHEWCTDNGFTPYLAVCVDGAVQVPMEYVKNNEIVLNVGFDATHGLNLGNETIVFKARFGGLSREIMVPVDHVVAIYARENGQGMAFPVPSASSAEPAETSVDAAPRAGLRLAPVEDTPEASAPPLPRAGWSDEDRGSPPTPPEPPTAPSGGGRPALKRIK